MSKKTKLEIFSVEYRKNIFDLYKDTFVCVAIAVLGVYLIKNDYQFIGWLTYIVAGALSILASTTTIKMIGEKRKSEETSKSGFLLLLFFSLFSIIILVAGLVKGVKDVL